MNDQVNNGDQGQNTSLGWRAALPDEFKEHEFVKNFQKPGDFVKAAIEIKTERDSLKSRLEESIPRLPKDASPEEVEVFYRSIGMPEKPDSYELPANGADPEMLRWAKTAFHRSRLTTDQAKTLAGEFNAYIKSLVEKHEAEQVKAREAVEKQLRAELGMRYEESLEHAKRFWKAHADSEFQQFVESTGLGNDPRLIRFVINVAKKFAEDRSMSGEPAKQKKEIVPGLVYDKSPAPPKR